MGWLAAACSRTVSVTPVPWTPDGGVPVYNADVPSGDAPRGDLGGDATDHGPPFADGGTIPGDAGGLPWRPGCTPDGWCWELPQPVGSPVLALWAAGPDDVWTVGLGGFVRHDRGAVPTVLHPSPVYGVLGEFGAVWGSGADDVWFVGTPGVFRWNGTTLGPVAIDLSNYPYAVWGTAPNDVWIGQSDGTATHWDGARWTAWDTGLGGIQALTGSSTRDVWATGNDGTIARWNGGAWRRMSDAPGSVPWVAGPDDAWRCANGSALHWDGHGWTAETVYPSVPDGTCEIASDGRGRPWVDAGFLYRQQSGGVWSRDMASAPAGWAYLELFAPRPGELWATGSSGQRARWSGTDWVRTAPAQPGEDARLWAVWGTGPDDIWATGGTVLHWDGTAWSTPAGFDDPAFALGVGGDGHGTLWIVGSRIARVRGTAVQFGDYIGRTLQAVHGCASGDVWAVGLDGATMHYDGAAWTAVPAPTHEQLNAVWCSAPGDAWAVGSGGVMLRWDGAAWHPVEHPPALNLYAIEGHAADDVWAVGEDATSVLLLLHWDGRAWAQVDPGLGTMGGGRGLWLSPGGDPWLTAGGTLVLHREAGRWVSEETGAGDMLWALWGSGAGDLRAVGDSGEVMVRRR